ncbi:hypothetical protein BDV59DRAFT_197835 [Aspergillus ambiguus]|uniref:uncharacterized protein n=1 Tax=Aspergillus ambiguus TaxID=176160 RepID=UPI003CCDC5EF
MRWQSPFFALPALFLLFTPSTAWTFVWHNAQNNSFVENGSSDYPCTQIDNPQGMVFEYDSEDDPTTINLYGNSDCSGTPSGQADNYHTKAASDFIGSFLVIDRSKTSSTTAAPSATTTQSVKTVTASAGATTTSAADSSSSLSGGAIAGVVVGVVAGVALVAALIFFLVRRRKKAAATAAAAAAVSTESPDVGAAPPPPMQVYDDRLKEPIGGMDQAPRPMRVTELPGDSGMVEMSDTHRVNELEDSSRVLNYK